MSKLAQYNKTLVAVLGLILLVGTDVASNLNNLLPPGWITALNVTLGLLTAFLTFWVRNETLVESVVADVAQPSLGHSADAASKVAELVSDVRTEFEGLRGQLHLVSSSAAREPVSVVVNTSTPESVPVTVPAAATGTYPDGPYVPPVADPGPVTSAETAPVKPAFTGPIPPVSEPVGATAVSAAP